MQREVYQGHVSLFRLHSNKRATGSFARRCANGWTRTRSAVPAGHCRFWSGREFPTRRHSNRIAANCLRRVKLPFREFSTPVCRASSRPAKGRNGVASSGGTTAIGGFGYHGDGSRGTARAGSYANTSGYNLRLAVCARRRPRGRTVALRVWNSQGIPISTYDLCRFCLAPRTENRDAQRTRTHSRGRARVGGLAQPLDSEARPAICLVWRSEIRMPRGYAERSTGARRHSAISACLPRALCRCCRHRRRIYRCRSTRVPRR